MAELVEPSSVVVVNVVESKKGGDDLRGRGCVIPVANIRLTGNQLTNQRV